MCAEEATDASKWSPAVPRGSGVNVGREGGGAPCQQVCLEEATGMR